MAKTELVPGPAEPKEPLVPTTMALDQENLDWLDGISTRTKRSRSEVAREIFRNVREASGEKPPETRRSSDSALSR